jgi:putative endopeptidase
MILEPEFMKLSWLNACAVLALLSTQASAQSPPAETNPAAYGSWGFDLSGEDTTVKPGDDFFNYANGGYVERVKIPPDQTRYGSFNVLRDLSEARVHAILESAAAEDRQLSPETPEGKIGAAYRAFMDEARVEALGAKPLSRDLQRLRSVADKREMAHLMGVTAGGIGSSIFQVGISADDKDPNRYVIQIGQGGLGLPDRDYYLEPAFAAKKAAYQRYVALMLSLIGWPEPEAAAKSVVDFETAIAAESWTRAQMRDPDAIYNPITLTDLQTFAPGLDWSALTRGAALGGESAVIIDAKSAFPKLSALYASTPLKTLKAWEAFHMADDAAPYLSKAFTDAAFEFRGRTLTGQEIQRTRWKRAVTVVNHELGEAVGKVYVARYFPPQSKAEMERLIANLKSALGQRIQRLEWMSPATKAEALKKLAHFDVQVGYPKKWRDYRALVIRADDAFGNFERSEAFEWAYQRARLHSPVDKDEWLMTPQTVNAYNNPDFNEVVFPAAILQPPFFNPEADPAVNYGAIGAVIGHEMTHGFDDQGRKYDAGGRLRDWWTSEDAKNFDARAAKLGAAYEKIPIVPGAHINGQLTMGENIADLGGLLTALDAYHESLGGKPAPVIDGLTGDQRFFLAYAQIHRGKAREDATRQSLVSDPHSPERARVDGVVPNVDDWYKVFNVQPGDKMYLSPDDRVHIW